LRSNVFHFVVWGRRGGGPGITNTQTKQKYCDTTFFLFCCLGEEGGRARHHKRTNQQKSHQVGGITLTVFPHVVANRIQNKKVYEAYKEPLNKLCILLERGLKITNKVIESIIDDFADHPPLVQQNMELLMEKQESGTRVVRDLNWIISFQKPTEGDGSAVLTPGHCESMVDSARRMEKELLAAARCVKAAQEPKAKMAIQEF
jgi:hypothetical protein